MRTLVDLTALPADRSGVGRYLDELVRALDKTNVDDSLVIACQARDEEFYGALAPRSLVLPQRGISRVWVRLLWEQFVLPRVARNASADTIHSPHYTLPFFTRIARVVTFHDATFFSEPQVHTRLKRVFFRSWIRVSIRWAARIIVPSRATSIELARYVGEPRNKYRVVYHGVDREVFAPPSPQATAEVASKLGLEGAPWITFLGTIEPRKNLVALLSAYSILITSWDDAHGQIPTLAIAGGAGWGPDLESAIAATPAPGRVVRLGYVDVSLLPALLGGAVLVVYPSLGEGFGLPVLEGMACGAPVLTTRRLAIPEVGGTAVAYTEPDAASIAHAIQSLISDPQERARLSDLGLKWSAEFTWTSSAAAHRAVYREAAQ